MKKIISIALMLALCLSLFAGCDLSQFIPGLNNGDDGLVKAEQYLNNYFQGTDAKTATDYQVPGIILIDGVTYNVEWTTNVEAIVVTRLENNMVQIDLPELAAEKVDYVLTATVSNANGETIQFTINREIPKSDSIGKNDEQIVEEAYALPAYQNYDKTTGQYKDKDGNVIEGTVVLEGVTVTGVIKSIRVPYDAGYNNITVIIQVGDLADKPIDCYRLTGDGIADLAPGDTVTIQGTMANYQGTVQFSQGAVATEIVAGPEVTCPATPAEILAAAKALAEGWALPYKATLTGVVTEITSAYAANYQNLTCNIEVDGNKIICYRLLGTLGENLKVGDTITVTGYLMNYKGDLEFGQGCTLDNLVPGQGGSTEPTQPSTPSANLGVIEAPVAGTAYKFGMVQGNLNKIFYLAGGMNGYYMATTEDAASAIDVYLEETTGGYYLYCMVGGAKTYINMVISGTHVNGAYEATASTVYTYDATSKTVKASVTVGNKAAEDYWFGTRNDNTYTTVGPCAVSYNGFYCQFYGEGGTTPDPTDPTDPTEPTEPTPTEPSTTPSTPKEIVEAAYALEKGAAMSAPVTLTGKIIAINTPYNSQFQNISVDIVIEGCEDKPILCFRLKGTGAEGLAKNDTITVTGTIKNYNGTIEFDAGCTFTNLIKGEPDPVDPDAGNAVTINLGDAANRTSQTTAQQVWAQNGITVTNDKAASTSNVADYVPARFYQSSSLKIEYAGMKKIVFDLNSGKPASGLVNSITVGGNIASCTVEGYVVTIELVEAVDSFEIAKLAAQIRVNSISVYA